MFLCVLYSWRESSRESRKDCMLCSSPDEGAGFEFKTVPEHNKAGCVFRAVLGSSAVLSQSIFMQCLFFWIMLWFHADVFGLF